MNKIAVITSVVGISNFDMYLPKHHSADYFLFTDTNLSFSGWNSRKLFPFSIDKKYENRRAAKVPKILSHLLLPDYDYYIWHDYTNLVMMDPQRIIDCYLGAADFALFKHPQRDCWYQEALEILKLGFDHEQKVKMQMDYYSETNVLKNNKFFEATAFVRKNNEVCNNTCSMWYEHMDKFSSRDQISLPSALQKYNPQISVLPGYASILFGNNDVIPAFRPTLRMQGLVR